MSLAEEKSKRWRFWQFSLRSLMLLTLVVAAFFAGWKAHEISQRPKPVPVTVKVVPLRRPRQPSLPTLDKALEDDRLLRKWELKEQLNRVRQSQNGIE